MKYIPARKDRNTGLALIVVSLLVFFSFIGWGMEREMGRRAELIRENAEIRVDLVKAKLRIRYACSKRYMANAPLCRKPSQETEKEPPK